MFGLVGQNGVLRYWMVMGIPSQDVVKILSANKIQLHCPFCQRLPYLRVAVIKDFISTFMLSYINNTNPRRKKTIKNHSLFSGGGVIQRPQQLLRTD